MTKPSACPSCGAPLGRGATKCRCGWKVISSIASSAVTDCFFAPQCTRPARVRTDRYTKPGDFQSLCRECDARLHSEKAEAWCKAQGLLTTEQKIAYCKRMAGSLGLGVSNFEEWTGTITQRTVDVMLGTWTRDDEKVLKRWQAMDVIDEHFKLVPREQRVPHREPGEDTEERAEA